MRTKVGLTLSAALIAVNFVSAQTVRIGVGAGLESLMRGSIYTSPLSDFGYGFSPAEFSFSGLAKIGLPSLGLDLVFGCTYIPLSGNDQSDFFTGEDGLTYQRISMLDSRASLFAASIGPQWFVRKPGIGPYVGLRLSVVHMSSIASTVRSGAQILTKDGDGWTRLGFGITGGIEIPESSPVSIDIGGHYNFDWMLDGVIGEPGLDEYGLTATVLVSIL